MPVKVACIVGTRPEAVKLAPIVHGLRKVGPELTCRIVATGQHRGLLDQALADFQLSADVNLDLMKPGQGLAELTGRAIVALCASLADEKPDLVMSVGDTTTVFTTALASYYQQIPFAHVEAGLRTGEPYRPFPEEKNRELAARLATLHFAPTKKARENLLREGISPAHIHVTGNTVIDALDMIRARAPKLSFHPPGERFVLVTTHRRENWGEPMERIAVALKELLDRHPSLGMVIPAHPNPEVRRPLESVLGQHPRALLIAPLPYPEFVAAMMAAALIVTDSGGVQEEGPALGKQVLVLRPETERPETLGHGSWLVGTDPAKIISKADECLGGTNASASDRVESPFGDGRAAERIVDVIARRFEIRSSLRFSSPPPWPGAD